MFLQYNTKLTLPAASGSLVGRTRWLWVGKELQLAQEGGRIILRVASINENGMSEAGKRREVLESIKGRNGVTGIKETHMNYSEMQKNMHEWKLRVR